MLKNCSLFFCLSIFFLLSCKKERDTSSPSIIFSSPQTGATFYFTELISISAHVTDNIQLASVKVSVTNANGQEFLPSINYVNVGREKHVSTFLIHNDLYLSTGTYYVTITANDGENEMKAFREIHLVEAPTELQKVYVVRQYSSSITEIDSLVNNQGYPFVFPAGVYGKGAIDSRFGIFAIATESYRSIVSYNTDLTGNFDNELLPEAGVAPYFNCVTHDITRHQIFFGADDNQIWNVNQTGNITPSISLSNGFNAHHIVLTDDFVFAHTKNIQNTVQTISVFTRSTDSFFQSLAIDIDFDIKGITVIDDHRILIVGNQNGQSLFKYYNNETNALNNLFTSYNASICQGIWEGSAGYFYVAHYDGLVKYNSDLDMLSTGLQLFPLNMAYEKLSGSLYVATSDGVHILNSSATVESSFISVANCRDVLMLYNK